MYFTNYYYWISLISSHFVDIPLLNENNTIYIEAILTLDIIKDILSEIMVLNSTLILSYNILNTFKK